MVSHRALSLLLILAGGAQAGWSQIGALTGTPQDLVVIDGGVIVCSANQAQAIALDGGVFGSLQGAVFVGAGLAQTGCLVGLTNARVLRQDPKCGSASSTVTGTGTAQRFRVLPSGAVTYLLGSTSDVLYSGPGTTGPFTALSPGWLARTPRSLGSGTVAGAEVVVCNQAQSPNFFLGLSIDGGPVVNRSVGFVANDAVPFSQAGQLAVLAVVTDGGLAIVSTPSRAVTMPGGLVAQTVAFVTDETDAGQRGYGLVTTSSGAVLSPIPDPAHPAETWVVRPNAPQLTGPVHCENARLCAGLVADGGVQALQNRSAPSFTFDAGAALQPGPVTFSVDAGDLDGDPVFISWDIPGYSIVPSATWPDHREVQLVINRSPTCNQNLSVTITAWDGLGTHEHAETFLLPLPNPLGVLTITPTNPVAGAGGPPVLLTAAFDAGCGELISNVLARWSVDGVDLGSTTQASVLPPRTVCNAGGVDEVIRATVGAEVATTTLHIAPWGPAESPTFSRGTQDAGTTRIWSPNNLEHACAVAPGFPGTALVWAWDAGDSGIVAQAVDGGLSVTAPECLATTFSASATRSVVGSTDVTAPGTLAVEISPNLAPANSTTPFSMAFSYDAGIASGEFTVGAICPSARELSASVEVALLDGGVVARQTFPAPGPWSLAFTQGCAGGSFVATARLFERGRDTGAFDRTMAFTAPAQQVSAGAITPTTFTASCGAGAHGTVRVALAPGSCEAGSVTWSQRAGPAITPIAQEGRDLTFQTVSTGFELVGTTVVVDAEVSAGPTNHATASAELHIDGPRFVSLKPDLAPVLVTTEELVVATVLISNESECAADALVLSNDVGGLVVDLSSVRLDGRPIAAQLLDQTLVLEPFALDGKQARALTFAARPRLLGTPRLASSATLRGVPVDLAPTTTPGSTPCGCSSLDASLGLLALLAWRRRSKAA